MLPSVRGLVAGTLVNPPQDLAPKSDSPRNLAPIKKGPVPK